MPLPFGPNMPNTLPWGTSNETPFNARTVVYDLARFFTESTALIVVYLFRVEVMGFCESVMNNNGKCLLLSAKLNGMATVLITGGTGLVGKALGQALLEKGYRVIILTRSTDKKPSVSGLTYAHWDTDKKIIEENAIKEADYIIHLAGAGVAEKRWTNRRKEQILSSRVQGSELIVKSLREIPNKVRAVVSASAIGWYGADPVVPNPVPFTEDAKAAAGFLGDTCKQWEESIEPVASLQKRLVKLRIGIVLSKDGGAVKEFVKPMKWGVAVVPGNGKQVISWIHIDDLVRMFITAIENESMEGVYNAVAPEPVSNREFVIQLAKSRNKIFIPVRIPPFVLKIVLGEMSTEVLKSATVSSDKIVKIGFNFRHPVISSALSSLAD